METEHAPRTGADPAHATILPPLGALEILAARGEPFLFLDAGLRVRFVNAAAERQFGVSTDRMYGRHPWEEWAGAIGTGAEDEYRRAYDEQREVRFSVQQGAGEFLTYAEVSAYPAAGGVAVFVRDTTAEHRALDEANEAATALWQESAELAQRNAELARTGASLSAVQREADEARAALRQQLDELERLRASEARYRALAEETAQGGATADERLQFLVEASTALAQTLEEGPTLDTIARLAVAHLADGAMITLVRQGGAMEHVTTVSRDGTTAAYAAETERMYPLPAHASSGYPRAIRTGEPELVPAEAFHDEILPHIAVDDTHLARLRHLDMYSALVVPLVARGTTLGAMTLVLHGPERRRPFDERDLSLAMELAQRAALALDNARLYDAEHEARDAAERAAELTRRLQDITASFARTITVNEVAATTLSHGLEALRASAGTVWLLAEGGDALELVRREGLPDEVLRQFQRIPLDAPLPVMQALRTGRVVWLPTRDALFDAFPELRHAAERMAPEAWATVPLLHDGRGFGAITLGFPHPMRFDEHERALLDALGQHCAQAMVRARAMDAERDARDEAERANQAKSELLAKVSHETRQPVHASIGWVDTLEMGLSGPVTDAQREALRRIKQNQLRLLSVLNDLLDISRIEAGRLELRMRDVALAEVADGVESAVAPQVAAKRITLRFDRPAADVAVRADVDQLVGIMTNLLSNAAKFTPEGGEIAVTVTPREGVVRIAVRDTGIGIPGHLLDRVFEPFFQVESGFTRKAVGTGLGLAISREAARAMGGELTVESELGRGACFTVELRRA